MLVHDTSSCGNLPTYKISKDYVKRQKSYGPYKTMVQNIIKNDLEVKCQGQTRWYVTHRLVVTNPHSTYLRPMSKDKKIMAQASFAENNRKNKNRMKNSWLTICLPSMKGRQN